MNARATNCGDFEDIMRLRSGGSPLRRNQRAVQMEILVNHALVIVAVPRTLVSAIGIKAALLAIWFWLNWSATASAPFS